MSGVAWRMCCSLPCSPAAPPGGMLSFGPRWHSGVELIQQNTDSFSCPSPLGMFVTTLSLAAAAVASTLPRPYALFIFYPLSDIHPCSVFPWGRGKEVGGGWGWGGVDAKCVSFESQSVYDWNEIGCREGHESECLLLDGFN